MDERTPPPTYFHYSPSSLHSSPHNPVRPSSAFIDREGRYLSELMAERQKLGPFMQILPLCSRLLTQEIMRASGLGSGQNFFDHDRIEQGSPLRLTGHQSNGGPMDLEGWSGNPLEESVYLHRMGSFHASPIGWHGSPGVTSSPLVKKIVRLDVPVDQFPNYNFVGRLLGPRGNSLKRVEATTHCRVFIRGRGSVKDAVKEDKLRDKPGYEHLNEQLHVLVEAELPADLIDARLNQAVSILEDLLKPMDESVDFYKKQQLRELALLNGTFRDENSRMSPSLSPFNSAGMKRAKTISQ